MLIDREKFRQARLGIDRPQAWVARRAGISKQALQHYLDGRSLPPALYPKLTAILGTTDFLREPEQVAA